MIESKNITDKIPLRFSDRIINESKMLIESKMDSQCPDYSKFVVLEESKYVCLMPYVAKQVGDILETHFYGSENINDILDATAHIGCDTINFRERFGANCISLELDQSAYECLVQNQQTFTKTKKENQYYNFSVHCNCIDFIKGFKKKMDFVYFDPPRDVHSYCNKNTIMLFLEHNGRKYPLHTVVTDVFEEGFCKTVVVNTPYNFDMCTFRQMLGKQVKCQSYTVMKQKKEDADSLHNSFLITICTLL